MTQSMAHLSPKSNALIIKVFVRKKFRENDLQFRALINIICEIGFSAQLSQTILNN